MMTNAGNERIYRLWAPIYDATLERFFAPGRRRGLELLAPRAGERVLLVGVGTGSDLPLLPAGVRATGIDLSDAMLAKARRKIDGCAAEIELRRGDAQALSVDASSFDAAVLHLILSVVPDPRACLDAALRALRPHGRAVVFDKFQTDGERPSRVRRLANHVSSAVGTDITRRLGDILHGMPCRVVHDEPSILGGLYRVVLLEKV